MALQVLSASFSHLAHQILSYLDHHAILQLRITCQSLCDFVTTNYGFVGNLNDRKLRRHELSVFPVCSKLDLPKKLAHITLHIKTLIIGKLTNAMHNAPLDFVWDTVEEISFTRAVSSKNYHALLHACRNVRVIRINYLAMGARDRKLPCFLSKWVRKNGMKVSCTSYELPVLKSVYVDRGLDTTEYMENRKKGQFKHFDANLYFKAMARLIDDLEQEVQRSILDLLRAQIEKSIEDDPSVGFFFTKPNVINRFPMTNEILNIFARKLRA